MPSRIRIAAILTLFGFLASGRARAAEPALDTEDKKTIYAFGLKASESLRALNLTEAEVAVLVAGLTDGVLSRPAKLKAADYEPKFREFFGGREKTASDAYVAKMKTEKGAKTFPSGLIMFEIKPGTGPSPTDTDTVKVHYHGTLRDGTVFDSSVERGQPAEFPIGRVIPCWVEALKQMKVGEKAKIVCPASIAYQDRGQPPKIGPNAALTFEVELLEIEKPGASPAPPAPGGK
ncbi:MAG: FKBP-type peptidyl-prolyl cis-trans isomerase [Acidobacteriota bacterium]